MLKDCLLIFSFVGTMLFGFFIVKFLERIAKEKEQQDKKSPSEEDESQLFFSSEIPDEDIIDKVRGFEKRQGRTTIALFQKDGSPFDRKE